MSVHARCYPKQGGEFPSQSIPNLDLVLLSSLNSASDDPALTIQAVRCAGSCLETDKAGFHQQTGNNPGQISGPTGQGSAHIC